MAIFLKAKENIVNHPSFVKFGFRIRTRVGVIVDNLTIHGRDAAEAQRKLRQVYRDCEILECARIEDHPRGHPAPSSYEDILGLISH